MVTELWVAPKSQTFSHDICKYEKIKDDSITEHFDSDQIFCPSISLFLATSADFRSHMLEQSKKSVGSKARPRTTKLDVKC